MAFLFSLAISVLKIEIAPQLQTKIWLKYSQIGQLHPDQQTFPNLINLVLAKTQFSSSPN